MKKNIILIMADQFRGDCIGFGGNKKIITPYLDDLAEDGCFFDKGYSPSPTCVPARACLVTGKKASRTGFFSNDFSIPWTFKRTLMERLHDAGYQTINVGKNHFCPQRNKLGFEVNLLYEVQNAENGEPSDYHDWLAKKCGPDFKETAKWYDPNAWPVIPWTADPALHPTEWTMKTAIEQLQKKDPTRPFYLQISFHRPHPPLDPPLYILDMYKDIELDGIATGDWDPQFEKETHCLFPFEGKINEETLKRAKKAYYASITHIDAQIGKLVYYLKQKKLYEDTTIIFISDHGEMMGDHNMFRKGPFMEGSVKVPFIVKFAKGVCDEKRHKSFDVPVSLLDIMPTFLDLAEADKPSGLDGTSILDIFENPEGREYIFSENYRSNQLITTGGACVVTRQYKYVWNSWLGREYLFDLKADPNETKNLALNEKYGDVLEKLRDVVISEYKERPEDDMLNEDGTLKKGRVLPAYRKPYER